MKSHIETGVKILPKSYLLQRSLNKFQTRLTWQNPHSVSYYTEEAVYPFTSWQLNMESHYRIHIYGYLYIYIYIYIFCISDLFI